MDLTDFEAERPRLTAATRIRLPIGAGVVLREARLRLTRTVGVDGLPAWFTNRRDPVVPERLPTRHTRSELEARDDHSPAPLCRERWFRSPPVGLSGFCLLWWCVSCG